MSFRIAIAGKGGTGKTTVSSLIIRSLVEAGRGAVLAVDADPNSSLALALGMAPDTTLADVREEGNQIGRQSDSGMSKQAAVELALQTAVCEGKGVDMVVMGRPEGPGCYCYVNNMLRGFLDKLGDSYPYVLMDNEAGMEHLSRRTTDKVDLLVIVYEPTVIGITTAQRLDDLRKKLPVMIKRRVFVANRVPVAGISPEASAMIDGAQVTPHAQVPIDQTIYEYSAAGRPVFDLPGDCAALTTIGAAMAEWEQQEKAPTDSPGAERVQR